MMLGTAAAPAPATTLATHIQFTQQYLMKAITAIAPEKGKGRQKTGLCDYDCSKFFV